MNKGITVLLFAFAVLRLQGQNQKMNWYFGKGAAITFSSGKPEVLTDNPLTDYVQSSASISDKNTGELLFYTNGSKLMDGSHQLIKDNLTLFTPNIRDVLIIENHLKSNSYFLVIMAHGMNFPGNPTMSYYTIDMVDGKPVISDNAISFASGQYQKMTAVRNCKTGGSWLLTYNVTTDEIIAFDVGAESISPFLLYRSKVGFGLQGVGDIVSNSTGNLIALSEYSDATDIAHVVVMEMDQQCGIASSAEAYHYPSGEYAYGLAFSPNSRFLYVTYSVGASELVQFELGLPGYIAIARSSSNFNELQPGPDGKIYISTHNGGVPGPRIDVINKPNSKGFACDHEFGALDLGAGRSSNFHFPNFVQDYSEESCELAKPDFEVNGICLGKALEIEKKTDFNEPDSFFWLIGGQRYNELLPEFTPTEEGTYQLQFVNVLCHTPDTQTYEITVSELKKAVLGNDTSICRGSELVLNAGAGANVAYYWKHNGSTDSVVTISSPGWYWVELNPKGCRSIDSIRIDFKYDVWIDIGGEYFLCEDDNDLIKLDAGKDFDTYKWLPTGDTTQWIHVNKVDSYFVIVEDFRGCKGEDGTVVRRRCKPFLFFPTAFSPNGDGLNDNYLPIGQDVVDYQLEIYNLWGELVFSSTDIARGWNGTFREELSPIGQYLWTCSYTGFINKQATKLYFESGYLILTK